MTLPVLAQHLAAHGRNGDEVLVHMTRQEVAGLDSLARQKYGRGLSTNPNTGLPEASLLGAILPAVLGIGGSMLGIPPMLTAGLVGGGRMLAGGSLMQGLTAGLGAFGGAGIGEGLQGMGALGGASAASSGAASTIGGGEAAAGAFGDTSPEFVGGLNAGSGSAGVSGMDMAADAPSGFGGYAGDMSAAGYDPGYAGGLGSLGTGAGPQGSAPPGALPSMGAGQQPTQAISPWADKWHQFSNAMGNNQKAYTAMGMAAAPLLMEAAQPPKMPEATKPKGMFRPYRYDPMTQKYTALPMVPVADKDKLNTSGYARGGIAHFADGGGAGLGTGSFPIMADFSQTVSNPSGKAGMGTSVMAINPANGNAQPLGTWAGPYHAPGNPVMGGGDAGHTYNYDPTTQKFTPITPAAPAAPAAAPGAAGPGQTFDLTQPGQMLAWYQASQGANSPSSVSGDTGAGGSYAKGGGIGTLLRGPGDGVSDSIPAHIGGQQPAALADGEYIVPARVVSELGNGSTEAGARQLDAMVKRVQQARAKTTGGPRSRVAVDSKAYKAMPA